jgi:hypothetical protein
MSVKILQCRKLVPEILCHDRRLLLRFVTSCNSFSDTSYADVYKIEKYSGLFALETGVLILGRTGVLRPLS